MRLANTIRTVASSATSPKESIMAEIYAPDRGVGRSNVPSRGTQTRPAKQTNKGAIITAVIAVAAIVVLIALIMT
jgi:apolipoprotein N-acyltransferase